MADQSSVIELIFRGIDQASSVAGSTAKNIGDALGDLDGQAQTIAGPFAALADQLLAAEAAALAVGLALTAAALNAAGAFDDGFKEITTLIDQPTEALEGLRGEILAYAATSTASMAEVNGAFYNAISLGVDYTDSVAAVTAAEKLAVAGKADLNITLQAMIGTMNAYGDGMDDAGRYSDIFFNTVKAGKTTIPELAASISGVTGTAALGKVSFEEIAAAIATLTSQGAPTSAAITQINATLSAIIKPTSQAADLAESLGIEFDATALASKGLGGVLKDVGDKTGGSAEKMAVLFSSAEALKGAVGILANDSKKFNETLALMKDGAGATEAAFAKMKDSTVTLANAVIVALVAFGAPMLDGLEGTQEALGGLALAFIKVANAGGLQPLQDLINDDFAGITATIEAIAENLPAAFEGLDWSGLIDSLTGVQSEVGELFKTFFGEIDLTTVEGLASALQTVMNTFESLTRVVTGIIGVFQPVADTLGSTIRGFNELDAASKLDFGTTLGGMKLLVDAGTGLGLALIAIGQAGIDMSEVIDTSFGFVKVAVNGLQIAFDAVALKFLEIKKALLEKKLDPQSADWWGPEKIKEFKAELAEVNLQIAAVTANLDKNGQEFDEGAAKIENAGNKTDALRQKMADAKSAVEAAGKAAQDTGDDWAAMAADIKATSDHVDDTVKRLSNFKIDAPTVDWGDDPFGVLEEEYQNLSLGVVGNPFEDAIEGVTAFGQAAEDAGFGTAEFADSVKKAAAEAATGAKDGKNAMVEWGKAIGKIPDVELPEGVKKTAGVFREATQAAKEHQGAIDSVSTVYEAVNGKTVKATGAFKAAADTTQQAKDQLDALTKGGKLTVEQLTEITKTANDFEVKMEEIASNERIKNIEAAVSIKTEGLKADAERVKSVFASIDNTVTSTGDTLNSLFGNYANADSWDKLKIDSQIRLENKRRQEALDLQKKMAEKEMERIEAQIQAMNRGDALIKIEGDGLKPELEAFMWKILSLIRVRANAEFSDYLLGIGAT